MTPDPQTNNLVVNQDPGNSERQSSSWDIKNAPRNYFWLVIFQAGSAMFSFVSVLLLTRYLGADGYGGIVAIIAASQVAQVLVNWTSVAVVRFGVDEFIETEKIARTFWIRLIVLSLNLALVLIFANLWFPPLASWLKISPELFWLVVCHILVTALWIHVQMSLQGTKQPRVQGFLQMIERLIILLALVALVASATLTQYSAVVCYILTPIPIVVYGLYKLRHYIAARFEVDKVFVQKLIRYSLPLFPMSLVGYFSGNYLDAIFVSKYMSISDLGIYSVATQISGIALQLPTLANSLLIPLFISLEKESQNRKTQSYFSDTLPTVVLTWGALVTVAGFACQYIIPVVFGIEFSGAVFPLWILFVGSCVGLPVLIGYSALSHALSATYVSMVGAILSAITNVVLNSILIPRFGLLGCAWATVMTFFVSTLAYALLLRRSGRIRLSWMVLAMVPALASAVTVSFTKSAILSLSVFAVAAIIVAIWKRRSLDVTLGFIREFK